MGLFDFLKHKKKVEKEKEKDKEKEKNVKPALAPSAVLPSDAHGDLPLILEGPHITEKTTDLAGEGKYVFEVSSNANKTEIKKAIEKLYKVKVVSVNILNMPSKIRRVGRTIGHLAGFKKAIVSLQKGHKIDIFAQ